MNRFSLFLISLALTAFVCGCGNGNSHKGHSHGDEVSAEAGGHSDHAHGDEAHSHDHEDGHDHGHEGEGHLLLTAYSDGLEFFAETGTFVAGQEVSVLLHVTELQDFKPYVGEDVSVCLVPKGESAGDNCGNCSHGHGKEAEPEIEGEGHTHQHEGHSHESETHEDHQHEGEGHTHQHEGKTEVQGIYRFCVRAEAEGEANLVFSADGQRASIPVRVFGSASEASEYAESLEVRSSNGAVFPKEKSWSVDFATEEAVLEPFGQVIRATSRVQPSQEEVFTVSALTDGVVSIGAKALVEGREVRKGETLCIVKGSGTADENLATKYARAEADYNFARNEYERKKALASDRIVSESELRQAEAAFEIAKAVFENLKGNFDASGQSAKSPIEGFVTSVTVSNGQFVRAGDPIATVSRSRSLLVVAEIQPRYSACLKDICGATFKDMDSGRIWTLDELGGKVVSYGKSVSSDSPLIPVTFSVPNKGGFIPGSFLQTRIITRSETPAITLPTTSLIEEQGNYFVYRQLTPEYFEKTPVTIGASDGLRTEIRSGLSAGERVVSKGAMFVKLAQASGALDPHAGHNH
ncbi:MAG: efflux RND transporter periplasmic adaptor subunit [Bacteroidales bacterium]|uniref:efflux RND transporter periplasmic adaptor subunit n=1 Tax=Candidatus Cryptobacteroides sp. TaxID=2952915 RepID=UPI002A74EAA0|nr:efflux RND transporter periplasmic adaptor subunit [Candidatus Cryptobacteroides sp.]MDD7234813.1 efflux RND transporter periplasmic adaptor subunit [Bacteroidales bacterium]MDY2701097.1 efflux RND transporter periplasmic adaptor subunit [Candidatus Cryptobacteroides sp.]